MAKWLRDLMTVPSRARYLTWRAVGKPAVITVSLGSGERLVIRREPAGDLGVTYEVFVLELYRSPRPLDVKSIHRIVDVGANVGYSVAYLAHRYPAARIDAFEPHPVHVGQIARNLSASGLENRVTLHPVAAGVSVGSAWLVDAGVGSYVSAIQAPQSIRISVVDFFETIGSTRVDLLKMDCEGSEYPIVMDPRFAQINVATVVMEWHVTPDRPTADRDIFERMEKLGWSLEHGPRVSLPEVTAGIVWAYKPPSQARTAQA